MASLDTLLGPAGLSLALLFVHWLALTGMFAASTARYSFIVSEDTDQHRLHVALAMHRLALLLWMLAVISGAALFVTSGRPVTELLDNVLWPAKFALVLLVPVFSFYPWWYIRQHAVVRSYGWVQIPALVKAALRLEMAVYVVLLLVALLLRAGLRLNWP